MNLRYNYVLIADFTIHIHVYTVVDFVVRLEILRD